MLRDPIPDLSPLDYDRPPKPKRHAECSTSSYVEAVSLPEPRSRASPHYGCWEGKTVAITCKQNF
eukprot:scaffold52055_cov39-Tisochrysis_lutea.AAC.3